LQQLHASYAAQIHELQAVQRMQADALRARQQLQHLHSQFQSQAGSASPSSPSAIKYSALPDHLSGARFPYLLS
jgi:hypothetical protein